MKYVAGIGAGLVVYWVGSILMEMAINKVYDRELRLALGSSGSR